MTTQLLEQQQAPTIQDGIDELLKELNEKIDWLLEHRDNSPEWEANANVL